MGIPEPQPEVTVVVPARNAASTLDAQLVALVAQAPGESAEIVVVDNDSSDATPQVAEAWARRFRFVRLVRCTRIGVNPARNTGVREARADLIVICDADDVVDDVWISAMRRGLVDHPLVGGSLEGTRLNSQFAQDVRFGDRERSSVPRLPVSHGHQYAFGGNIGFRRGVFDTVGGFDESFPVGGADEIDFCLRAQEAGFSLGFASDAIVHVRWRSELRGLMRQSYRFAAGTSYLYSKRIAIGAVPPQPTKIKVAMFKAYWRRLSSVGSLRDRAARWRLAIRLSWIAGSLAAAPRNRVLV